ncbi:MAG: hypothetical protein M3O86_03545 [Actinomycetota bacterium]|nr:hypothetical protein [Actinomycetota bacterium]
MTPGDADGAAGRGEAAALSGALREVFARVAAAPLAPEAKQRWHQRLLAITTTAKRDTSRAAEQLTRFCADWQAAGNDHSGDHVADR